MGKAIANTSTKRAMELLCLMLKPLSLRIKNNMNSSNKFLIRDDVGLSWIISPKQWQFSLLPLSIWIIKKIQKLISNPKVILLIHLNWMLVIKNIPIIHSNEIINRAITVDMGKLNHCKLNMYTSNASIPISLKIAEVINTSPIKMRNKCNVVLCCNAIMSN